LQIERIMIEGGFLDGLDLTLSPGLNVLIGGRGTGKTSIIEEIRQSIAQNNGLLGIYIHHLKNQRSESAWWRGAKPDVPYGIEFPAYDWDGDLDRLRKEIEAAGRRSDAFRKKAAAAGAR
jgi:hypothetical protein